MSDVVISVKNLSKQYVIGHAGQYATLRDTLSAGVNDLWNLLRKRRKSKLQKEEFWALKDICFDIKRGQVVGIIGRNGAGKSTLLKILSRITEPTEGTINIKGRVASLLEVGTGFHPELTGRENVFLNGAILGMSRSEIQKKFDEIVSFAEVERFLDTPVKHYSSGMYVRLAFSVAAHLEPDILIVDEVLAVGDAAFQKKCTDIFKNSRASAPTVLVVSHNLPLIQSFCNSGIFIQSGKTTGVTSIEEATTSFLQSISINAGVSPKSFRSNRPSIQSVFYECPKGVPNNTFTAGSQCRIILSIASPKAHQNVRATIAFTDSAGQRVFALASFHQGVVVSLSMGTTNISIDFILPHIFAGAYALDTGLYLPNGDMLDETYGAGYVVILDDNAFGWKESPRQSFGVIKVDSSWTLTSN